MVNPKYSKLTYFEKNTHKLKARAKVKSREKKDIFKKVKLYERLKETFFFIFWGKKYELKKIQSVQKIFISSQLKST